MSRHICLFSVSLLLLACESGRPPDRRSSSPAPVLKAAVEDYSFCGRTTSKQRIDEYFAQLARFLEASGERGRLRNLVAENVVIVEGGRSETVPAAAIVDARSDLISLEDWAEISRRGEPSLESGGWRGCFLSNGKSAFEVDESGYLRLSSFNANMAWDADTQP
jgi:hypothetical protein